MADVRVLRPSEVFAFELVRISHTPTLLRLTRWLRRNPKFMRRVKAARIAARRGVSTLKERRLRQ